MEVYRLEGSSLHHHFTSLPLSDPLSLFGSSHHQHLLFFHFFLPIHTLSSSAYLPSIPNPWRPGIRGAPEIMKTLEIVH